MRNRLSSFLLAISAAFSSLDIPAMLVGGVLSAVLGSGRGDDNGVDRALEAGENAGARAEGMMGLRGCGASVCVICEGWDVRHESGERLVGRDDDAIAPHSSGLGELARSDRPNPRPSVALATFESTVGGALSNALQSPSSA